MQKILCLLLAFSFISPTGTPKPRPKFEDYPVKEIYRGAPATPQLSKNQRYFRTRIREGAKSNVEFAGHYTIPRWGCGTGCSAIAIVDSITGQVYDVPFSIVDLPGLWLESHDSTSYNRIEFHPNSQLMKIDACPNEKDCGFYDYIMVDGKGLKLIRKELLPKKFQPE